VPQYGVNFKFAALVCYKDELHLRKLAAMLIFAAIAASG
jgi:hypothetical protein